MRFYNPRLSMITFGVSVFKGTVQVSIAKTLDPNFKGMPSKGQKIYDWENTAFFSLSPEECLRIMASLDSIIHGTYNNPKEKNPKYANVFSITHFQNEQPSRLLIDGSKSQQGAPTGSIVITLIPPQGKGQTGSYVCRPEEFGRVKFYLGNGAKYLDFTKDVFDGIERIKSFQNKETKKETTPAQNTYNKSYNKPQTQNQQPTPATSDPWDSPAPQQPAQQPQQQTPPVVDNDFDSVDSFNLDFT